MKIKLFSLKLYTLSIFIITFSLGFSQSPGGQNLNLNAWYKADAGTLDSVNILTTVNGEDIYIWKSQNGDSTRDLKVQASDQNTIIPTAPNYSSNYLNYNPGISFEGDSDRFINNVDGAIFGDGDAVFYMVSYFEDSDVIFFNQGLNSNVDFRMGGDTRTLNGRRGIALEDAFNLEQNGIFRLVRDEETSTIFNGSKAFNGKVLESDSNQTGSVRNARTQSFGGDFRTSAKGFDEQIAEIIIYTGDFTGFPDHSKIESYLALKYGLTLDQTQMPQNYVASNSTIMWDTLSAGTYDKDIFGIGRDSVSELHQRISTSVNNYIFYSICVVNLLSYILLMPFKHLSSLSLSF